MRKVIQFHQTSVENGVLVLHTEQDDLLEGVQAAGQIIADSDRFAFVYLAENAEEYVYLYLEEPIWQELKNVLDSGMPVVARGAERTLELHQFQEELQYLVENIQGNGNYGDEMVAKVEAVFFH
ncbi:hypothetical protein RKD55_002738 [Rossellomorea marisflavi]